MADAPQAFVPKTSEKTFSNFDASQGANYAKNRPGYQPQLFELILSQHTSTHGQVDTLVDVGCGPGTATVTLAKHFDHAIGLDPSEGMISTARAVQATTKTSEPVRFEVSTAEDLGWHLSPPIEDSSVDLITAATCAHWFDMQAFWKQAARLLKPGGTVALWTTGDGKVRDEMPNADKIRAVLEEIEERELKPYFEPGNLLTRNLYKDLGLPWTVTPPVTEFDESSLYRKEWGSEDSHEFHAASKTTLDLDTMEMVLGTMSVVQRWREAHPEIAKTEKDVVRVMRREIERLVNEAGVEKGKEVFKGSLSAVLLIVKKKI